MRLFLWLSQLWVSAAFYKAFGRLAPRRSPYGLCQYSDLVPRNPTSDFRVACQKAVNYGVTNDAQGLKELLKEHKEDFYKHFILLHLGYTNACSMGHVETVKSLTESSEFIKPGLLNYAGLTTAIQSGQVETVRYISQFITDPHDRNNAFQMAVTCKQWQIGEMFKEDVNDPTKE